MECFRDLTNVQFINMISEVVKCIQRKYSKAKRIGLLATSGTISSGVYNKEIDKNGLDTVLLSDEDQKKSEEDTSIAKKKTTIEKKRIENKQTNRQTNKPTTKTNKK